MKKIDYIKHTSPGGSHSIELVGVGVVASFSNSFDGAMYAQIFNRAVADHHARQGEVMRLKDANTGEYLSGTLEDLTKGST